MRLMLLAAVAVLLAAAPGHAQLLSADSEDASITGADARIRPGDEVSLEIWMEEDMTNEYSVDENGQVVLPRLGIIQASDYTVGELRTHLREEYAKYLVTPAVEVTVLRRVGVHGEVREPDLYMIDLTLTLPEVIAKAGGLTAEGDPGKITIFRGGEEIELGREEYAQLTTSELRSGDQVVVGRRSWLSLNSLAAVSTGMVVLSTIISLLR